MINIRGEALNCGFGLVLVGDEETEERIEDMLSWDVLNGVARRSWSGNENAKETISLVMEEDKNYNITIPHDSDKELIDQIFKK